MESVLERYEQPNDLPPEDKQWRTRPAYILEPLLENLEKLWKKLKHIEEKFLDTRKPELLAEFKPDTDPVTVKVEKSLGKSYYLSDIPELIKNTSDDKIQKVNQKIKDDLIEDALLFNSKAEIREIKTKEGKLALAIIGVDFDIFDAFRVLRDAERKAEHDLILTRQELDVAQSQNNIKPFARKNASTEMSVSR